MMKMEKYYRKENSLGRERINDVYVPKWAQTLIDLYTSDLKYEMESEMYKSSENSISIGY